MTLLLPAVVGNASKALDKFALWFLTGFGAGLALILSNLTEVTRFVPLATVILAGYLYFYAVVLGVAGRYVAMAIDSGVKSGKSAEKMMGSLGTMDIKEFFAAMISSMPYGTRWMCKGQYAAMQRGDITVAARMMFRLVLLQGALVSAELVLLVIALYKILAVMAVVP